MLVDDSRHHDHLDGEHGRGAAVGDEPRQHQSRDNALTLECGRRVRLRTATGRTRHASRGAAKRLSSAPPSSTPVALDERGSSSRARRISAPNVRPAPDDDAPTLSST